MKLLAVVCLVAGITGVADAQSTRHEHPDSARIVIRDVEHFWEAYSELTAAATRADSVRTLQTRYFDRATPGLRAYIKSRLKKPDDLLMGLGMLPRYFAAVRENTLALDRREGEIRAALRRLEAVYPAATFPDIYFVIAGFISQGTVGDGMLLIAAEMVSADSATPMAELPPFLRDVSLSAAVLPCIIVHEVVHAQQNYPQDGRLLAQVLGEGIADFVTQLAVGCVPTAAATYKFGEAHERELWLQFRQELSGNDNTKWLYNGNKVTDRPSNLGYWMGYQIAQAYYNAAGNKQQALHDMLNIRDFSAFLAQSKYGQEP